MTFSRLSVSAFTNLVSNRPRSLSLISFVNVTAADGGAECVQLHAIVEDYLQNPPSPNEDPTNSGHGLDEADFNAVDAARQSKHSVSYVGCGQHRLHNSERAATTAELPSLMPACRRYMRALRRVETSLNDCLRRIQTNVEKSKVILFANGKMFADWRWGSLGDSTRHFVKHRALLVPGSNVLQNLYDNCDENEKPLAQDLMRLGAFNLMLEHITSKNPVVTGKLRGNARAQRKQQNGRAQPSPQREQHIPATQIIPSDDDINDDDWDVYIQVSSSSICECVSR